MLALGVGIMLAVVALVALYWVLDLEFEQRVDVTGIATLVLAAATAYLALTTRAEAQATRRESEATTEMARGTQEQVEATAQMARETRKQALASRELVKTTRDQVERAHRPVLAPSDAALPRFADGRLHLEFENVGMGPALNVQVTVNFSGPTPPWGGFLPALAAPMTGVVSMEQPAGDSLGERTPTVLKEGQPLHFHAVLGYQDVAGIQYWTDFAWWFTRYTGLEFGTGDPPDPGPGKA
jgi:hypothetical protein